MFSRFSAALAATCLCCQPATALYVDKLQNRDVLNTGSLEIQIDGACQAQITLNEVSLHTFNPLDATSEGLWLSGQATNGESSANYYNMVLIDQHLNVIAAYAPARIADGQLIDNGLNVQTFNEESAPDSFKSRFSLHAAQDSFGALDGLLAYLSQYQPQVLNCDNFIDSAYLTTLDEAQSSVVVTDSTVDTSRYLRTKTTLDANSVAAVAAEQLENSDDGSYRLQRAQMPLHIRVQFRAEQLTRY